MHRVEPAANHGLQRYEEVGEREDRVPRPVRVCPVAALPFDHDAQVVRGRVDGARLDAHRSPG